jgi:hypothetical protein
MRTLASKGENMTVDYIGEYFNENGFDFTRLLNDDFF